jgi:hypothetical protein
MAMACMVGKEKLLQLYSTVRRKTTTVLSVEPIHTCHDRVVAWRANIPDEIAEDHDRVAGIPRAFRSFEHRWEIAGAT